MATIIEKRDRHVIPRWVSSRLRTNSAEFAPAKPHQINWSSNLGELKKRLSDWESNRSLPFAADLLGAALVLDQADVAIPAALFILQSKEENHASLREMARRVVGEGVDSEDHEGSGKNLTREELGAQIHSMRERLRDGPSNPLLWTDLALAQASLGKVDKAKKYLLIANGLAPHQRFILRATARFHVHCGRPDEALDLLRRSPLVKVDPWILSAEIAVSDIMGRTSSGIKRGRSMLESGHFSAEHISELASAIGTLEAKFGGRRKARRLLEQSLEMPTENAVAQATWVVNEIDKLDLPERTFDTPHAFEAKALHHYYEHNWLEAVKYSLEWQLDEPFSVRPAVMGSHLAAAALEDYDLSARIARQGLTANPKEFIVANNLAFALASAGKVREALQVFEAFDSRDLSERHQIFYFATSGLMRYRLGEHEEGREFYRKAVRLASSVAFERERVRALSYFAREEVRINSPEAHIIVSQAERALETLDVDDLEPSRLFLKKLLASLGNNE